MLSFLYYYSTTTPSKFTFFFDTGADGIEPPSGKVLLEPRFKIGMEGAENRKVRLSGSISVFTEIQDPLEDQILRTRNRLVEGRMW